MNPKIEELIDSNLETNCPLCSEEMITLPGPEYLKEGSRWGYHSYSRKCLVCDYRTNYVKIHGKVISDIHNKKRKKELDDIVDVTPPFYGESLIKRIIKFFGNG